MSERLPGNLEKGETLKPIESAESINQKQERELTSAEKQHGNHEHVEKLASKVEQEAISGKEFSSSEREKPRQHPVLINKHLKDMAFSRAMTRARKKLSIPSRLFSKTIHVPIIDRSSEFIGKTVARPSSMLSGAIFAFVGTSLLLWLTRKYGYEYNYLLVILLFAIGAVVGIAGEGLLRIFKKEKS